jgi:CDGSH-type Zn-finger protein
MQRRRWIDATKATPSEIAATVERCPTGALRYDRKDGGPAEQIPERNEVRMTPEGQLYLHGNVEIHTSWGMIRDTRVALCGCGASQNKPFCDGSHETAGFYDSEAAGVIPLSPQSSSGVLRVLIQADGPYVIEGALPPGSKNGAVPGDSSSRLALCRCGKSQHRPYCDGSHQGAGFKAA